MLTLVLETSTAQGSLALFDEEKRIDQRVFRALRGHNSKIFAPLRAILEGLGERKLARLVVATGPGSYAGVRIGISIADALALSHGAELIGCSSFIGAQAASKQEHYWIVGDARRQSWYRAEVRAGALSGGIVTEERAAWEDAVRGALGAGIGVYTFDAQSPFPGVLQDQPTAETLGALSHHLVATPGPVEPSYLAAPYITRAKRRGAIPTK